MKASELVLGNKYVTTTRFNIGGVHYKAGVVLSVSKLMPDYLQVKAQTRGSTYDGVDSLDQRLGTWGHLGDDVKVFASYVKPYVQPEAVRVGTEVTPEYFDGLKLGDTHLTRDSEYVVVPHMEAEFILTGGGFSQLPVGHVLKIYKSRGTTSVMSATGRHLTLYGGQELAVWFCTTHLGSTVSHYAKYNEAVGLKFVRSRKDVAVEPEPEGITFGGKGITEVQAVANPLVHGTMRFISTESVEFRDAPRRVRVLSSIELLKYMTANLERGVPAKHGLLWRDTELQTEWFDIKEDNESLNIISINEYGVPDSYEPVYAHTKSKVSYIPWAIGVVVCIETGEPHDVFNTKGFLDLRQAMEQSRTL